MHFQTPENHKHTAWDKGKLVGQKATAEVERNLGYSSKVTTNTLYS